MAISCRACPVKYRHVYGEEGCGRKREIADVFLEAAGIKRETRSGVNLTNTQTGVWLHLRGIRQLQGDHLICRINEEGQTVCEGRV